MSLLLAAALAVNSGMPGPVEPIQQTDPFTRPPPGSPSPAPRPSTPGVATMEDLVRQGYEVKGMERFGTETGRYLVLLQRSADVRTCLMRIEMGRSGDVPARRTACF